MELNYSTKAIQKSSIIKRGKHYIIHLVHAERMIPITKGQLRSIFINILKPEEGLPSRYIPTLNEILLPQDFLDLRNLFMDPEAIAYLDFKVSPQRMQQMINRLNNI
jgi:hypothetical protein